TDSPETFGHVEAGRMMIMLNRDDYWQCAFVIRKGSAAALQQGPVDAFRRRVLELSPFLADRIGEIKDWSDVKLLTVAVDRLRRWYRPGFLAIGDAAHAMSPIGGVGINLAIQDAVAAANLLAGPLRRGSVSVADLAAVQARREFPMKVIQAGQIAIQKQVIDKLLSADTPLRAPWPLRLLASMPAFRGLAARIVGVGVRPEHVAVTPGG
ncbi:MAG TPA: FAD-dependent monooxygenase, partial [Devosia sp.]|nr:FAD-dependent monooxygenase [Devosia sp.]